MARGHLLIEDLPGVGKTTLAHVLARAYSGLDFQRIQFTSDMLPADILGVSIFDRDSGSFHFHPGPVFAQAGAGRRNQPRHTEGPERAAGGDGGTSGHR
jgi:MoxR-like ATPase